MPNKTIGILVGSARKNSFTQSLAQAISNDFPNNYEVSIIPIDQLPLFNQNYDSEGTTPDSWTAFRQTIAKTDAFLFITPEYNRSVPALLKNAIDIASYPSTKNNWSKKPGAIIGASPGAMGGFGAAQHLRQIFSCINIYTMSQPEAYLNNIANSIDKDGQISNPALMKFLQTIADSFVEWIEHFN